MYSMNVLVYSQTWVHNFTFFVFISTVHLGLILALDSFIGQPSNCLFILCTAFYSLGLALSLQLSSPSLTPSVHMVCWCHCAFRLWPCLWLPSLPLPPLIRLFSSDSPPSLCTELEWMCRFSMQDSNVSLLCLPLLFVFFIFLLSFHSPLSLLLFHHSLMHFLPFQPLCIFLLLSFIFSSDFFTFFLSFNYCTFALSLTLFSYFLYEFLALVFFLSFHPFFFPFLFLPSFILLTIRIDETKIYIPPPFYPILPLSFLPFQCLSPILPLHSTLSSHSSSLMSLHPNPLPPSGRLAQGEVVSSQPHSPSSRSLPPSERHNLPDGSCGCKQTQVSLMEPRPPGASTVCVLTEERNTGAAPTHPPTLPSFLPLPSFFLLFLLLLLLLLLLG